ncbi:biotin/lipoyl-containing protein [Microbacterium alcoholitolerans]|uniref:biotin/lipoyl-containing protein n=1 Tax=unclassified Microbacterium TaxID=2609290 RepID=UPI003D16BD6A
MDIILPKWGMTMQEAEIISVDVAVGDVVTEGQSIVTVETEKVDAEVEAPAGGTVAEIFVAAGDTVAVGAVVARLT